MLYLQYNLYTKTTENTTASAKTIEFIDHDMKTFVNAVEHGELQC
jgi:hypothetical protein